jgi:hypothetical protein
MSIAILTHKTNAIYNMSVGSDGFSLNGIRREYGLVNVCSCSISNNSIEYPVRRIIPSVLSSKGMLSNRLRCNPCLVVKNTSIVQQSSDYTEQKGKSCIKNIISGLIDPIDPIDPIIDQADVSEGVSTNTSISGEQSYNITPTDDNTETNLGIINVEIMSKPISIDNAVNSKLSQYENIDTAIVVIIEPLA